MFQLLLVPQPQQGLRSRGHTQVSHRCDPCGHAILCKKCAMKMATGGKCMRCGEFFVQLKRVH